MIASIGLGVPTVRGSAGSWVGTNERQAGPKRSSNCLANYSEIIAHESTMRYVSWMMLQRGGDVSSHFGAGISKTIKVLGREMKPQMRSDASTADRKVFRPLLEAFA